MKTVQIFNLKQADLFLKHGATAVGTGKCRRTIYIEFLRDEVFEELIGKWHRKEFNI